MSAFQRIVALACVLAALGIAVANAAPASGGRLQDAVVAPLNAEPKRKNFTSLGTTLVAAVDTENTNKVDSAVQMFVVTNDDTTDNMCFGTIPLVAGDTCNSSLCDTASKWTGQGFAGKMNCTNGDASQGSLVVAGASRIFRYDGTRCACIVGSAAGVEGQVERVVR